MKGFCWGFGVGLTTVLLAGPGLAQGITLDGTLGPAGGLQGPVYEIEQGFGATVGTNLFQSFGRFDLAVGERANFASDAGIENILGRVTGGTASSIDGLLFTRSPAVNLFLINPSGIVFGPNARLNVGGATRGSFFATTLDGVVWPDGGRFEGVGPQGTGALLNIVGDPSGFVASQRVIPGIEVNGSRLVAQPGQSLVLLGGDVVVDGATIRIDFRKGGPLTLGGLVEAGTVGVVREGNAWRLGFPEDVVRGDVRIGGDSLVTVVSNEQGELAIYGRDVEVLEGSRVAAGIAANGGFVGAEAGELLIDAQGKVVVAGDGSQLANNVNGRGTGTGGDLRILAKEVEVRDRAQLSASTRGTGGAGNVLITAGDRVLFQNSSAAFSNAETGGEGKGGNVVIDAPILEVRDGAQLAAGTLGTGDAGNVVITAGNRVLFQNFSAAFSSVEIGGEGKGGNVLINAPVLEVRDGAQLIASTRGTGDAGSVVITAGDRVLFQNGFALSRVAMGGEGQGGNVVIDAPILEVRDNAVLVASTEGTGDAGDILITAGDRVLFQGANTGVTTLVETGVQGKGGNVMIDAPLLEVLDGAQLIASTFGTGDAGNVVIRAGDRVLFQNSSAAFSNVGTGGEGQGGNVVIEAPILEVLDGAQLIASTDGTGDAGNVVIRAGERVLFQNSSATFSGVETDGEGKGGNVVIEAPILEVLDGAQLIASTDGTGDAGNVLITAGERVLFQGGNTAASSRVAAGGEGQGGDVMLVALVLEVRDGAILLADTLGTGNAGNVRINAGEHVLFQNGDAFSNVGVDGEGQGGNVVIEAPVLEVRDGGQLIANTRGTGDAGSVVIAAGDRVLFDGTNSINGRSSAIFTNNGTPTASAGTGTGGNISIAAPQLQVSNGAVFNTQTVNDQPGGNITLNLATLNLLSGGQLLTTSDGSGPAGNILLTATDQINISGTDPTYAARRAQFGTAVAPTSEFSTLSVRANSTGPAGNIILNTPRLTLDDRGQIIAESTTGNGGNIFIGTKPDLPEFANLPTIRPDAILLRNNSLISATAGDSQNPGDGGNITLNTPFLIGFPNNNSDIIANAFSGTGGNITITADAILNFQINDEPNLTTLRGNRTNDISASSQFGTSGTLNLTGLNVDPSQGTGQLANAPTDPADTINRRCNEDRSAKPKNEFYITGNGGIPYSPGDPYPSVYTTGTIQATANGPSRMDDPSRTNAVRPYDRNTSPEIQEATHWQRNASGQIQLIASDAASPNSFFNSHCSAIN